MQKFWTTSSGTIFQHLSKRHLFNKKHFFLLLVIFFHIFDIPSSDNRQMYKKGKNNFCISTLLLIIFIEEYNSQQKISSEVKNLKTTHTTVPTDYDIPGVSNNNNIQSDKSPSIINTYCISRNPYTFE